MNTEDIDASDLTDESEEYGRTAVMASEKRWKENNRKGFLYRPKSKEILIDIDTEEQWQRFSDYVKQLKWVTKIEAMPSHSGEPHRHVIVTMDRPIPHGTRLALQAVLGDPVRGFLDLKTYLNDGVLDTCLFLVNERK